MIHAEMYFRVLAILCVFLKICGAEQENNTTSYDVNEPLLLTPYLDSNQTEKARNLSIVDKKYLKHFVPPSHAGFLTVDRTLGNHLFFWFFPSHYDAPLVLWLNGGPGISSMLGLFYENGPMTIINDRDYVRRKHSWAGPFSMLYVDNPVNVGLSFSDSGEKGERTSSDEYAKDLYSFLEQFLEMFPKYKKMEIYIGGQSYAGMYIISLAYYIHEQIQKGHQNVHFTGIYLGGPYFDPQTQLEARPDFFYTVGFISKKTCEDQKMSIKQYFSNDTLLNITLSFADNLKRDRFLLNPISENKFHERNRPPYADLYLLMRRRTIMKAIHAGHYNGIKKRYSPEFLNLAYGYLPRLKLQHDFLVSRKDKLAELMNNYKVLIYSGDLDGIIPFVSVEASLLTTPWKLRESYTNATLTRFRDLGQYIRLGKFCRVVISGAGHQTPYDQPVNTLFMMESFVDYGCIR